jgi:hypothetical protein
MGDGARGKSVHRRGEMLAGNFSHHVPCPLRHQSLKVPLARNELGEGLVDR